MAIVSVDWVDSSLAENYSASTVVRYTERYRVISDDPQEYPWTVVNAAGIPLPRQKFTLYGADLFVISRVPIRESIEESRVVWTVEILYENNHNAQGGGGSGLQDVNGAPVATPDQAVKEVDISWREVSVPITKATFVGFTAKEPLPTGTTLTAPPWLYQQIEGKPGRIVNSSTQPVEDAVMPEFRETITVIRYELNWNNAYFDFINTINNADLRIQEIDQYGTRFDVTYPKNTLLMRPITKQNFWVDGVLYYRVSFPMEYNPEGHQVSYLDQGTSRYVSTSQTDPLTGSNYTSQDLQKIIGTSRTWQVIELATVDVVPDPLDPDGIGEFVSTPLAEPVPLNGYGSTLEVARPAAGGALPVNTSEVYSNWGIYFEKDWSTLNL